jgi:hypothetical protein
MDLWLRTFVWTFCFEMLTVVLSVLAGIGTIVSALTVIDGQPSLVLILGLIACWVALSVWWHQARKLVGEPASALDDTRPFSARLAADMTTALLGVSVLVLCIVQITTLGEPLVRWALLATILGGPFIALGLGTAWERWHFRAAM